ncbi:hypothetical protein DL96DRAFT_1621911 [Flagelloscypha sp. PMI_526]|nr:hypothetical protein DL96DRAFT_1621911 [Flagelloscypha sp. PMI_526]
MGIQTIPSLSFSQISCIKCSNAKAVISICGQCGDSLPLCIQHTPRPEEKNQPIVSSLDQAVLGDRLREVEQQISAFQNLIDTLSSSRDALESWTLLQRGRQAPIHKIPSEILLLVMDFAVDANDVTGRMDALVLSQISHRWRALARSASFLWSRIRIYEFPLAKTHYHTARTNLIDQFKLCLRLAKGKLLDIEILDVGWSAYFATDSTVAQLSFDIVRCCQQWKSLTVSIDVLGLFFPANIRANHLRDLRLTGGIRFTRIPKLVNSAPALRCLDMTSVFSRASKNGASYRVPLDQLREFQGRIQWNDWSGIPLPTLDTLVLHIDRVDILDYTDSKLCLPHLQCLSLVIFERFSCPELLFLTLKSAPISDGTTAKISSMLVDATYKNCFQILHLHDCDITSSSLQSLLALLPSLTQFTLVDRDVNKSSSPLDCATYAWMLQGALLPRLSEFCIGERCSLWKTSRLFFFLHARVSYLKKVTLCASINEGEIMEDNIHFVTMEVEALQKLGLDITFRLLEGVDWEKPDQGWTNIGGFFQ